MSHNKETEKIKNLNGQVFHDMFSFAVEWFAKSETDVNALNVFPVPDGDTGTNMLLTMRSAIEESARTEDRSVSTIAGAIAFGSLMGARGNSGVILSQIWRGMSQSIKGKEVVNGLDLAESWQKASAMAYEALENPVEGTMLTVIKEIALACQDAKCQNDGVLPVLQTAVKAAGKAVANTPNLLPVLKEAGVVDSGGQGLYILLEGALMYLKGQTEKLQSDKSKIISGLSGKNEIPQIANLREETPFGYCTEFIIKGETLNSDQVRKRLKNKGQSLIVTGDENALKVHIHCIDPSPVIHYAISCGTISAVSIRNMDEQFEDMLKMQKGQAEAESGTSVVAIASGEGIINTFYKIGAAAIVPGGKTMNPSTQQILRAVEAMPTKNIIILPNDKNLVLVARQVENLTSKNVSVIPTVTIPQGIAALIAFDPEVDFKTNVEQMNESRYMVKTVEVTRATRSTRLNGFVIQKNQVIGLLDDKLLAVSDSAGKVITDILEKIGLEEAGAISIYYGNGTTRAEAEKTKELMCRKNPELNIDVLQGGQPLYDYLISIE